MVNKNGDAPLDDAPWRNRAEQDAQALGERFKSENTKPTLEVVTCGYDTNFEDASAQVKQKSRELEQWSTIAGVGVGLTIVDDTPAKRFARLGEIETKIPIRVCTLQSRERLNDWGLKGLALREGFVHALKREPDFLAYINLNLKSPAQQLATGLRTLVDENVDVAIGSRVPKDGGEHRAAGPLGHLKSRVYNTLVTHQFPEFARFKDTNGPMKLMRPAAAMALTEFARIDDVGLDVEWLAIWHTHKMRIAPFGLFWQQRRGSSVPWHKSVQMVRDLILIKRAFENNQLS